MADCDLHKLVADVALVHEGRVLLVRYADVNRYDHQRGWFLPDDLMQHLEHPEAAAARILAEQLDLEGVALRLGSVESFRGRDRTWHLAFHHVAELPPELTPGPSPDLAAAEWFPLDALPERGEVAHHGWALDVLADLRARAVLPEAAATPA